MRVYKKWYRFGSSFSFVIIFVIICTKQYNRFVMNQALMKPPTLKEMHIKLETLLQDLVTQEKRIGCEMPNLDPFSTEVRQFDKQVAAVSCDDEEWVECNFSECFVKNKILSRLRNITCTYKDVIYIDDDTHYLGRPNKVQADGKHSLNASDYVKISCAGIENNSRGQKWLFWYGHQAGFRYPVLNTKSAVANASPLNVLMLIIDSTSRNTFIRRLPISYKVLKEELQAVVMKSYNIVGESTAGALLPILTGHNEFEITDSIRRPTNARQVDPEPFIFTLLHKYGYRTALFEDMPWFHTFNYRYNGFKYMPVKHYMRLLFQSIGWFDRENWNYKQKYCFGSDSLFKFMVEYSAKLFKLSGKNFCVTISGTFSHDDINTITTVDGDLAHFLRKFKRDGHLKDTLFLVMSDHGSRIADLRNTYQGRIEEYLPFVSIVLPNMLKQARPKALQNLIANSNVLTTPFDIHTTILDALGLLKYRNKYKVPGASLERGMSFLEPILESRSCGEAGIMPHFCACARWQSVSANDVAYTKVALELAHFVNSINALNRQKCAKRDLLSIANVYRLDSMIDTIKFTSDSNKNSSNRGVQMFHLRLRPILEYYQAKIIMSPGEAIFEGAVQQDVKSDIISVSDRDVSRLDRYGDEAWCVSKTHPHLAKYCYCIKK